MINTQGNRRWVAVTVTAILMMLAAAIAAPAQTFKTLVSFGGTDGFGPQAALVQATNGNLYGTTAYGGANRSCASNGSLVGCGTIFEITPSGKLTTLYSFCSQSGCADGQFPFGGLVQAPDGNFYGTTWGSGDRGYGTVFKITPGGTLTTLYSFAGYPTDGANPTALVQASDGNFYGTTVYGGPNIMLCGESGYGCGTVFKITPSGALTTLHNFDLTDGSHPYAQLVQATDGDLYGTASEGGSNQRGTVFKITLSGTLTTLYNFCSQSGCTDGEYPNGLIQATDGDFYGTTFGDGANGLGTIFKITPSGTLTTLYSFCSRMNCTDGDQPVAGLVQATDGNFYGTTPYGGAYGGGNLFRMTPSNTLKTLYTFCSRAACEDGQYPYAGLVQDTSGKLYGTTSQGGANYGHGLCPEDCGTVFGLSVGLGPFVETVPTSAQMGRSVVVLGTNLNGTTGVTFNGTAAIFTVESATAIKTTVPTGATAGPVRVVTPSGTLTSNVKFRVLP